MIHTHTAYILCQDCSTSPQQHLGMSLAVACSTVPRKRLQALQLGAPAALVGALAATLAAAVNGQLMEVVRRPK